MVLRMRARTSTPHASMAVTLEDGWDDDLRPAPSPAVPVGRALLAAWPARDEAVAIQTSCAHPTTSIQRSRVGCGFIPRDTSVFARLHVLHVTPSLNTRPSFHATVFRLRPHGVNPVGCHRWITFFLVFTLHTPSSPGFAPLHSIPTFTPPPRAPPQPTGPESRRSAPRRSSGSSASPSARVRRRCRPGQP